MSRAPEIRFRSKVAVQSDGCWLWTGSINNRGYGVFYPGGGGPRHQYAHRWSYVNAVGPIPEGLELDHLCRRPACVNPGHLEPVTRRENAARAGRATGFGPHQAAKTHCPSGHAYSAENTKLLRRVGVTGRAYVNRICRTCFNANARKYYRRSTAQAAGNEVPR